MCSDCFNFLSHGKRVRWTFRIHFVCIISQVPESQGPSQASPVHILCLFAFFPKKHGLSEAMPKAHVVQWLLPGPFSKSYFKLMCSFPNWPRTFILKTHWLLFHCVVLQLLATLRDLQGRLNWNAVLPKFQYILSPVQKTLEDKEKYSLLNTIIHGFKL